MRDLIMIIITKIIIIISLISTLTETLKYDFYNTTKNVPVNLSAFCGGGAVFD